MALLEFALMPEPTKSFFCSSDFSLEKLEEVFQKAQYFKNSWLTKGSFQSQTLQDKVAVTAFFEPSTRTRLSFEIAAHRLKMRVINFGDSSQSSISKGESYYESLKIIAQMNPDLMILRWKRPTELWDQVQEFGVPFINAGLGSVAHPTQALSDAMTLKENFKNIKGLNVLISGDVKHSRVAASNMILLSRLGANVAYCCPEEFIPSSKVFNEAKHFYSFNEAIKWCDTLMCLRVQKERFEENYSTENFVAEYQLDKEKLGLLKKSAVIMHPGPFNLGVEITEDVLNDERVRIYNQAENGVYVRAALMEKLVK